MTEWIQTQKQLPQPDQKVDWISPGGIQVNGGAFVGGLVWIPKGSNAYVYYTPEFWRPAKG